MTAVKTHHKKLENKNKLLSRFIYLALIIAGCLFLFILYHAHKITDARFQEKIQYTDQILEDISIHYLWIIDNDSLKQRFNEFLESDEEINFIQAIDSDKNVVSSKKNNTENSLISSIRLQKDRDNLGQLSVGYSTTKTYTLRSIIQWLMLVIFLFFMLINALVFMYWRNDKKLSMYNEIRYKSIFENIATPILEVSVVRKSPHEADKIINVLKLNNSAKDFLRALYPTRVIIESNTVEYIPNEIKSLIIDFDKQQEVNETFDINFSVADLKYSVSISISKYTNIESNVNKCLISIYDLTEFKKQVKSQQIMQDKINTMQRIESIGKLAGGIAHDFNNILSSIMGYIEHSRIDTQDNHHMYFSGIEKAVIKAKEIVTQILFFSKKHDSKVTSTDLRDTVKEALGLVRAGIPESTDISIDIAGNDSLCVSLNSAQTTQIVMNLCTNSFHSMESGFGKIFIEVFKTRILKSQIPRDYPEVIPGQFCCIQISDNGAGIPQKIINKIFDPYFTTKTVDKGTGLGLSVVYGITVNIKGFITLESVLDEGTCICVYLPYVKPIEIKDEEPKPMLDTSKSAKVIFLDDNKEVTSISLSLLQKLEYQASGYHDPLEVLDLLNQQPEEFDVLISDVTMPNLSGIQLAKELRSNNINIPIILMSGYNSEITKESMNKYNIHKLLKKPFSLTELEQAIASAISNANGYNRVKALDYEL